MYTLQKKKKRFAFVVVDAFLYYIRSTCAQDLLVCVRNCAFSRCFDGMCATERPRLYFTHTKICWACAHVVVNESRTQTNENKSSKWRHLTVEWGTDSGFLIRISILVRAHGSRICRRHFVHPIDVHCSHLGLFLSFYLECIKESEQKGILDGLRISFGHFIFGVR